MIEKRTTMKEKLERISRELTDENIRHLIFVFDAQNEYEYLTDISDQDAVKVIKRLVRNFGGTVLDTATDELIQEQCDLDWPEIL
ncbi:MAG: hypothetical protein DMF63_02480 [Acidobacteria bacterium]|nr:MAG: hypothetical protein DMF63_02480 [Acidobacteriota bacterium]